MLQRIEVLVVLVVVDLEEGLREPQQVRQELLTWEVEAAGLEMTEQALQAAQAS
jgi:hypothetical protein